MKLDAKHILELTLLITVFVLGLLIAWQSPDVAIRKLTIVAIASLYPVWGIWHHADHKHLTLSIVWEYVLIGLLMMVVLLSAVQ